MKTKINISSVFSAEKINGNSVKKLLAVVHSDDEIETASIDYRDKSDNENTNEDNLIDVHWYDKQEAFTAGVKWFVENYC